MSGLVLTAALFPGVARAQGVGVGGVGLGTPWQVDSTVPAVLQGLEVGLPAGGGFRFPDRLQYEIGFSTREVATTGFLFDSLTISLSRADGSGSTILATGDVFGLTVAPQAPGGLLTGGGIAIADIVPRPGLLDGVGVSFAYSVQVLLPAALSGQDLRTRFDFFNNGDDVPSRGYAVVVPEPSAWGLAALGTGLLWAVGRHRAVRRSGGRS